MYENSFEVYNAPRLFGPHEQE